MIYSYHTSCPVHINNSCPRSFIASHTHQTVIYKSRCAAVRRAVNGQPMKCKRTKNWCLIVDGDRVNASTQVRHSHTQMQLDDNTRARALTRRPQNTSPVRSVQMFYSIQNIYYIYNIYVDHRGVIAGACFMKRAAHPSNANQTHGLTARYFLLFIFIKCTASIWTTCRRKSCVHFYTDPSNLSRPRSMYVRASVYL